MQGKTRAKQYYTDDAERHKNIAVLLHGDGAFSGQGIVYESLDMSQLPAYTIGGTIHVVVNNLVAFTTDPKVSRSTPYLRRNGHALPGLARQRRTRASWRWSRGSGRRTPWWTLCATASTATTRSTSPCSPSRSRSCAKFQR